MRLIKKITTLIIIINALVFSKLFYCLPVWPNAATINPLKLQAVQNIDAPIISNARMFDHVTPGLKKLRWLQLNNNCIVVTLCAFRYMIGIPPARAQKRMGGQKICYLFTKV